MSYIPIKPEMTQYHLYKVLIKGMKKDVRLLTWNCKLTNSKKDKSKNEGFPADVDLNMLLDHTVIKARTHFFRNTLLYYMLALNDNREILIKELETHILREADFCGVELNKRDLHRMLYRVQKTAFHYLARSWNLELSPVALSLQKFKNLNAFRDYIKTYEYGAKPNKRTGLFNRLFEF